MKIQPRFAFGVPGKSRLCLNVIAATILIVAGSVPQLGRAADPNRRSADGIWEDVAETNIKPRGRRLIIPAFYRTVRLGMKAMKGLLARAPMEFTPAAKSAPVEITLPLPDGRFVRFRVVESPIMEKGLADQLPDFKSYSGRAVDDAGLTVRLNISRHGFRAIVLTNDGTFYIDPYTETETESYISYAKRDIQSPERFQCLTDESDVTEAAAALRAAAPAGPILVEGTRHTYRLAMAATGEYTAFFRQPADTNLDAQVRAFNQMYTTMNRVNGIYEREVGIHMNFVSNNLSLVYTNASTDPYTGAPGSTLINNENQTNIDNVIGTANYDIGHVIGVSTGGRAALASVCNGNNKAQGSTGQPTPQGDPFDVDYVAHEMGHQFGGNHTFNDGTNGSCGGVGGNAQRAPGSAYEPGSGSTIMGYAGICPTGGTGGNLQLNSDAYFHVKSLEEILAFITSGGGSNCDEETPTGNTVPQPASYGSHYVPANTPFELYAGDIQDPQGDLITYNWEQYDLGNASPPEGDDGTRPIFRSRGPTRDSRRSFPSLQYVLNNANTPPLTYPCGAQTCIVGEYLPVTNRVMNFAATIRDNAGDISTQFLVLAIRPDMGPFVVTQPNTAVNWIPQTQHTVTWNVANSTASPVNAANVRISLSIDGGNSFPYVLADSTPNDGSETIVLPCVQTTQARIKVQSVGDDYVSFYDVSDTNFTMAPTLTVTTPNSNVGWTQRTRKTVTWTTTGSCVGPLRISLSTDSGATFPTILADNTPNDGNETITVPNIVTDHARIKVEQITTSPPPPNVPVVVDVSDVDFRIKPLEVTNANDFGEGSLREAINDANNTARHNGESVNVPFKIPGALGINTINVSAQLPTLTAPMTLDGWSQGGAGYEGPPLIQLNGTSAGQNFDNTPANGLVIIRPTDQGDETLIRGIVINRFPGSGMTIQSSGNGIVEVSDCWIGVNNLGTAAQGNGGSGISINNIGNPTVNVAQSTYVHANIISGNQFGITISGGNGLGNTISQNYIGTDQAGTADLGNTQDGIRINSASYNFIFSNLISGSGDPSNGGADGIEINGNAATANTIQGNYIGLAVGGNAVLMNRGAGINIVNAPSNLIGGITAGAGNVISGNGSEQIAISGASAAGNVFQGNIIGLNAAGTATVSGGSQVLGIYITSSNTQIGGTVAGSRNIISGNSNGIFLNEVGASGTVIQGNYIGTDITGTLDRGNGNIGIEINRAQNTIIGGTTSAARNVISGNDGIGIVVFGTSGSVTGTVIQGNYIGTNAAGTAAIGNGLGVELGNTPGVTLGGTAAGAGNLISGSNSLNGGVGLTIYTDLFNDLSTLMVQGNFIGTNAAGTAAIGNSSDGIRILLQGNTTGLVIGGSVAGARNLISANNNNGIYSSGGLTTIQGNIIGTDINGTADLRNNWNGIYVNSGNNNVIGGPNSGEGNLVAFSGAAGTNFNFAGIKINSGTGHRIRGNSIFSNTGLGINHFLLGVHANDDCDADTGSNNYQNFPVLSGANSSNNTTIVTGILNSTANSQFTLDFYSSPGCDSSGYGEGKFYLGSANVMTNGSCQANFQATVPTPIQSGYVVTATATDANGNTSEFSACQTAEVGPSIISFLPTRGLPGAGVTIRGTGFTGATAVLFNGVAATFAVSSDTEINGTVPMGASTGPISVTTPIGTGTSAISFVVVADSDGDGMSDEFEQQYFNSPTGAQPNDDTDGDGQTNLEEFKAGTNPKDPQSVFKITEVRRQGNDLVIVFPAVAGKLYQIEAGNSPGNFSTVVTTVPRSSTDHTVEVTDPNAALNPSRYYRVVVLP